MLAGAFVAIGITSYVTTQMLAYGWAQRGASHQLSYGMASAFDVHPELFFAFFVGLFLGFVPPMILDQFKRFQGLLLLIGVVVAGAALQRLGDRLGTEILVGVIDFQDLTVLGIVLLGVVITSAIAIGWERFNGEPPYRYTIAVWGVFVSVLLMVIVGAFEAAVVYRSPIVETTTGIAIGEFEYHGLDSRTRILLEIPFAVGLLGILGWFLQYESEKKAIFIGPAGSGKTWLMTGLHYTLRRASAGDPTKAPTRPNETMNQQSKLMQRGRFDEIGPTQENDLFPLQFEYIHGKIFPQKVRLHTLDHAGEHLVDLRSDRPDFEPEADTLQEAFEAAEGDIVSDSRAKQILSDFVYYADQIGLLLPMEDFDDPLDERERDTRYDYASEISRDRRDYVDKYASLLKRFTGPEAERPKDFFLVAAKADILRQDFEYLHNQTASRNPAVFDDYVEEEFVNERVLPSLFEYSTIITDRVYPVYFEVNPEDPFTEGNNIEPVLDVDDEQPPFRGAWKLLDRLGR